MDLDITPRRFYIIGVICFSIIFLANVANLTINWSINSIPSKISAFMGIIFNLGLVLFFKYLLKTTPDMKVTEEDTDLAKQIQGVFEGGEDEAQDDQGKQGA